MHLLTEYSRDLRTVPLEVLTKVEARGQRVLSSLQQLMMLDVFERPGAAAVGKTKSGDAGNSETKGKQYARGRIIDVAAITQKRNSKERTCCPENRLI